MTRAQVAGLVLLLAPASTLFVAALVCMFQDIGWRAGMTVVAVLVSMVAGGVLVAFGGAA